ncbi:hypothetical protein D9M68_392220 [compost metagenome]
MGGPDRIIRHHACTSIEIAKGECSAGFASVGKRRQFGTGGLHVLLSTLASGLHLCKPYLRLDVALFCRPAVVALGQRKVGRGCLALRIEIPKPQQCGDIALRGGLSIIVRRAGAIGRHSLSFVVEIADGKRRFSPAAGGKVFQLGLGSGEVLGDALALRPHFRKPNLGLQIAPLCRAAIVIEGGCKVRPHPLARVIEVAQSNIRRGAALRRGLPEILHCLGGISRDNFSVTIKITQCQ